MVDQTMGQIANGEEERQLQAKLWSKERELGVPEFPLSLPASATVTQLRQILEQSGCERFLEVDFLIRGQLVRTELKTAAEDAGIGSEAVVEVEVVRKQPAPEPEDSLPHEDWVSAVASSPDLLLSAAYDGVVKMWSNGKMVQSIAAHQQPVKALAWLPDHQRFASGSTDQRVVIYKRGEDGLFQAEQELKGHQRSVEAVEANADGTRLASGGFDSFLKVWNTDPEDASTISTAPKRAKSTTIDKSPMVTLAGHKEAITGLAWMPRDATEVATCSMDHGLVFWDLSVAGEKRRLQGPKAHLGVAVSPLTSLILTASVDRHVRLWDGRSREGSQVKSTFTSHSAWVSSVAWAPHREHQFISTSFDHLLKLWDTRSPKAPLYDLGAHSDRVLCSDWALPGLIASGSVDTTIKTFSIK